MTVEQIKNIFLEYAQGIYHLEITVDDLNVIAERIASGDVVVDAKDILNKKL